MNRKLRKARMRKNLTLSALAIEMEVSTLTVWRWEVQGQVPHPETMRRLKEFFKMSEEELGFGHIFKQHDEEGDDE